MTNQNPPHHHLLQTLTDIITAAAGNPQRLHELLKPYLPQLTSPLLLSLLPPLFSRHRFAAAKTLLVSFISGDTHNHLHRLLLLRSNSTKPLLDTAIGAYLHLNRSHLAAQLFRRMSRLRLRPNLLTLNTLLTSLARCSTSHSTTLCREIAHEAMRLGVKVDTRTFNVLIYADCLESKFGHAVELLEKMSEFGCVPDTISYNTILDWLCKKGMIGEARELLREMRARGVLPCRNTYNMLVKGFCGKGRIREAMKVTHNIMVKWYCKKGKMDEASDAMRKMKEDGFAPSHVTYNTVISAYCKAGKMEEAFLMRDEMGVVERNIEERIFVGVNCATYFLIF